jgi:hypothetical protein
MRSGWEAAWRKDITYNMPAFTVEQLTTLQNWMNEKGINECPVCGSADGFTNVVEIGQAKLSQQYNDEFEEGYMEERFGEVEPILLTSMSFGEVVAKQDRTYTNRYQRRVGDRSIPSLVKGLMDTMAMFRRTSTRHRVARITCGNCRYILLLDAGKIGLYEG